MAYSEGLFKQIVTWLDAGILPPPSSWDRVVELGSQMAMLGTPHSAVAELVKRFRSDFVEAELVARFPTHPHFYAYVGDIWRLCDVEYLSYDITEAPNSRFFDFNFDDVPPEDLGRATIVTNYGTSEHVANQLNVFRTVHDLLKVGGVAIHLVPFAGMLNHCLFNYHPKFFFSLIVNNRYRLRHVEFGGPTVHAALGAGNTVFEGDYISADPKLPGSQAWSETKLHTGIITLVIERRFADSFVPPVDFASGYFGDTTGGDLAALVGTDDLPKSAWAETYRRLGTPSQTGARSQGPGATPR